MASDDRGKHQERQEGRGDRAAERPEVLGHGSAGAAAERERDVLANEEGAGEEHRSPEATDTGATEAEVEGHFIGTNPYLMEKQSHARQQDFRAEAERQRMANQAAGDRGMVDRVKERFRGGTG